MNTKFITAVIALFTAISVQAATPVYNYDAAGNVVSLDFIAGLQVGSEYYNVSFSDTWDGIYIDDELAWKASAALSSALRPAKNGSKEYWNILPDAGSLQGTLFDFYPALTPGCENIVSHNCQMYFVTNSYIYQDQIRAHYVVNTGSADDPTFGANDPSLPERLDRNGDSRNYVSFVQYNRQDYAPYRLVFSGIEGMSTAIVNGYSATPGGFQDGNSQRRTFVSIAPYDWDDDDDDDDCDDSHPNCGCPHPHP